MSRVGKQPIEIPSGTKLEIKDGQAVAKGPKGSVTQQVLDGLEVKLEGSTLTVERQGNDGPTRAKHGLLRALLANAVEGVSNGFTRQLDIIGVGYRAEVKGSEIHFALGYSHPVIYPLPEGIDASIDKQNRMTLTGCDRQLLGQVAAEIRGLRPPDPYKGKGIRYTGEVVRRKVGKAGGK